MKDDEIHRLCWGDEGSYSEKAAKLESLKVELARQAFEEPDAAPADPILCKHEVASALRDVIVALRKKGFTYGKIADWLDQRGVTGLSGRLSETTISAAMRKK